MKSSSKTFGTIFIFGILCFLRSCSVQTQKEPLFDIKNPPQGWYRFEDPLDNYVIWLPDSWITEITTEGDFRIPTSYSPTRIDGQYAQASTWKFASMQFDDTYCSLLVDSDYCDPPTDIYTIDVEDTIIQCARYRTFTATSILSHQCLVGPYQGSQLNDSGGQISFYLVFSVDPDLEESLLPIWKQMVASFVLEQLPQANAP